MSKFFYSLAAFNLFGALVNLPFIDHPFNLAAVLLNVPLAAMNYFFAKNEKKHEARWGA